MNLAYTVRPEKRAVIPAPTHVDGTGRLQTVSRQTNPRYWALIKEFEKLTGVPVLLNTSFNENEPIVLTPKEAIDCFLRTRMDVLALGNFLIEKPPGASASEVRRGGRREYARFSHQRRSQSEQAEWHAKPAPATLRCAFCSLTSIFPRTLRRPPTWRRPWWTHWPKRHQVTVLCGRPPTIRRSGTRSISSGATGGAGRWWSAWARPRSRAFGCGSAFGITFPM